MRKYTCPSCGAEIGFQSSISVSCVCPFCRSLVVRRDADVESIGTMAALPQDMSPLQLGTAGIYRNVHFMLIGRVKIGWEDGNWNEWFMLTDEGKKGWLAEAQGSLAVNFEEEAADLPCAIPKFDDIVSVGDRHFTVADVKKTTCIGSEGELPFAAPRGRQTVAVDLLDPDSGFAGLEYSLKEPTRLFVGNYAEFNALQLTNLRELPGWDSRSPKPQRVAPDSKSAAW